MKYYLWHQDQHLTQIIYLKCSDSIDDGKFTNRAIQRTYPPGSVFKIVVLYAALSNKIVDENYSYNCVGKVNISKNEELKCNNLNGHGVQNLQQAFSNSCNTAFYDIALKTGKKNILNTI